MVILRTQTYGTKYSVRFYITSCDSLFGDANASEGRLKGENKKIIWQAEFSHPIAYSCVSWHLNVENLFL